MTLLELTEPLFQYVCRLSRSARKGVSPEQAQVAGEIRQLLAEAKGKAATQPGLSSQFDKIEIVLLFFADFMIHESGLSWAAQWEDLAHERNELAGEEKFFDLLDETLAEPGEAATERLSVFYTALGLGFTGWFTGQPEHLRKKMMEISGRIRPMMDMDETAKICPESYEHVNTADLTEPPGTKLVGLGIALCGLLVIVFAANFALYMHKRGQMGQAVKGLYSAQSPLMPASDGGE